MAMILLKVGKVTLRCLFLTFSKWLRDSNIQNARIRHVTV